MPACAAWCGRTSAARQRSRDSTSTSSRGDLTDAASLRGPIEGSEVVFHCAADYRLYVPDPKAMFASNVDGTRNVLQVAADCGIRRTVYTSTVGALGLPGPGGVATRRRRPASRR